MSKKQSLINIDSLPEDMQKHVHEDIEKYGESVVYWMLENAPLKKLIATESESENPEVWFQMAAHILNQVSSRDPLPCHYIVSREILTNLEGGSYEDQNQDVVNMLAIEIVKHCQDLKKLILKESNPLKDEKGFIIREFKSETSLSMDMISENGMLSLDNQFLDYLGSIGKKGKKEARELAPIFRQRFLNDIKSAWSLWVNDKETLFPPFLSYLGKICWLDVVKSQWKKRNKAQNKSQTFRQSRGLIDGKLDREITNKQLTFFDVNDNKDKQIKDLPSNNLTIKGLDLEQGEDRILHTLSLLLHKKSENKNQKSSDYYMGNYEKGIVSINQIEMETARLILSPHEFYCTYFKRDNYNSDHIKYVLENLNSFSKKQFLFTWNFPIKGKKGKISYNKMRTYCPLFQVVILNHDLTENESQLIDWNPELSEGKNCLFLFKFGPQFTLNIREKYVDFPEDIYQRITNAVGKDRFSQSINLMRDFLFREKQQKRYEITRDKKTLINILRLDKFASEGRKKLVNQRIQECLHVFLKIDLLESYKETTGMAGQDQFIFLINKNFK